MQSPDQRKAIVQRMIDAGESEENIAAVIQHFKAASSEPTATTAPQRSTLADLGIGAAKGLGETFVGLGSLLHKIPGVSAATDALYGMPSGSSRAAFGEVSKPLARENTTQTVGGYLPDAALMLASGGASAANSGLRQMAIALERRAIPALTKSEAQVVLRRGLGRATPANADALAAEAARTAPKVNPASVLKQTATRGRAIESAAATMGKEASRYKPWNAMDTFDLAIRSGGGGALNKLLGAAAGAQKVYSKLPTGTIPQAIYSTAPAINAVAGAGATEAAMEYLRSLMRGRDE